MAQGETTVGGEPNKAAINIRVPESMKKDVKQLCEFEKYSGPGELIRALIRAHTTEVVNSPGYKYFLKSKEGTKAAAGQAKLG